ncbi:unnamed protein product, partial [marine sediment metagenome]
GLFREFYQALPKKGERRHVSHDLFNDFVNLQRPGIGPLEIRIGITLNLSLEGGIAELCFTGYPLPYTFKIRYNSISCLDLSPYGKQFQGPGYCPKTVETPGF